jgi:glycosyltransferase involved in cell wall biosynthesis
MWTNRRAISHRHPDIFHANLPALSSCQYPLLAAISVRGTKTVAVEQLPLARHSSMGLMLKRFVSRWLDAHVAVGEKAAREIERIARLRPGSLSVVHNGVPDVQIRKRPRPASGPVIGSIARFERQKGLDVLISALPRLPEATLVLVGGGPERASLEALARSLGVLERVRLVDWTADARDYLGSLDVFVLPSRFEGFPLATVEAMLAELPVVVTDVGSNTEAVVDGENGLVVPADDVASLAKAVRTILADTARRQAMGKKGRARALAHFTDRAMANAFEALYDSLLGERGRSDGPRRQRS